MSYVQTAADHRMKLLKPSLSEKMKHGHEMQVRWRELVILDKKKSLIKYENGLDNGINCEQNYYY